MQKAIEKAAETKEQLDNTDPEAWGVHMDNLKPHINNMLQMYLPKHLTINDAEILGCVIFNIITDPEKYLNK